MPASDSAVVAPSTSNSPYQLDIDQTLKASTALLKHVKEEIKRVQNLSSKKSLLEFPDDESDSESSSSDNTAIWLCLTTKQHIVDSIKLRPSKIPVPHSLNKSSSLSICIISTDPQRELKNAVADPVFPSSLSSRITKIIGFSKLKAKYNTFENRRKLLAEHDIFLADDRVIARLPETLGKSFYKGTSKRPIPISINKRDGIEGKRDRDPKKKVPKEEKYATVARPMVVAKEIESALNCVPVSLRPGCSVAVRVGHSGFTPQQLAENVNTVALRVIEKHVAKGWRNVRSIHIKSPTSTSLPIWLSDDLWVDDGKVVEQQETEQPIAIESATREKRKRKTKSERGARGPVQKKARVTEPMSTIDEDRALTVARKAKLSLQKSKVLQQSVSVA